MRRSLLTSLAAGAIVLGTASTAFAGTIVPGHADRYDADGNGYPDAGAVVTGHYTSLYAYDGVGDYYWDLGDGRVQGTVSSVDELDQETLTSCDYVVNYRGSFENDPYMDSGWIKNQIKCTGVEKGTFNSTIVNESDPRYTGDPDQAIWGNWEYHVDTQSGAGNLARPMTHG
jgi:hypothetical protein